MTAPASFAHESATAPPLADVARLQSCLQHIAHLLPAQAPLRDFVHHNTLHALQHLPFVDALSEAERLTGARPWLDEARCRELFRAGRVDTSDLAAALQQLPACRSESLLISGAGRPIRRGDVLLATLCSPPTAIPLCRLRWLLLDQAATERLQADLDPVVRKKLLTATAAGVDERSAVAELWAAACELRAAATEAGSQAVTPTTEARADPASEATALWQELVGQLGTQWTPGQLLAQLTGEDFRPALQATLIRHLAAHLDQGLAAWHNPARAAGFYAAWRESAGRDWAWEVDEFAGVRHEIDRLPADPLQAILGELSLLGLDEARGDACLQRLALELPGWAGMFAWRESHPQSGEAPVSLADFLAVRVVLERLYGEQLVRRIWGLPLGASGAFGALGEHLVARPPELQLRHAFASRALPEEILDRLRPLLTSPGDGQSLWQDLAAGLAAAEHGEATAEEETALVAWPLFVLAQRLGLGAQELRALTANGADALLACAASLTPAMRGEIWLLAYERHYRQQILAALAANHGRMPPLAGKAEAQLVFCMDDREEGTRRHLEEVNPACETFGAAGFFGLPMRWQGLDDEAASALCPIVVRPVNAVREVVPAGSEAAQRRHQHRRDWRLKWQERLHQGSRRGCLQATLVIVAAAPVALLALLARTLAPGRLGKRLGRWREAFERPVPGALQLVAEASEARREASPEAPREGFSDDEQLLRVGGFLRSIGLTTHFAPLVAIVGHGSDSRNNPHLAAYDCGACSGRHGGPNARVLAALANRPALRRQLAAQGIMIPESTCFIGAEHNTCDESFVWYDTEALPASHRAAFAGLRSDCQEAARRHAIERCRRFASAPRQPSPAQARAHLANRRHDLGQVRPELGHATVAAAFIGRRTMSRGAFFDRRVFLISYDPLPDGDGRVLEATLLAAAPVGAGINLEYYFSTVNNEGYGCGSKVTHNLAGLFGVMQGAASDLRTGLPQQMVEVHEPMRLLVIVEQTQQVIGAIYQRQPALQELVGNGWVILAACHPETGAIDLFRPATGWQPWRAEAAGSDDQPPTSLPEVEHSADWFAGHRDPLPPALLRRPLGGR
ncbi:MAG: DUF2309 domain-containing protein [Candidatus Accumulibacter sp. UW26]|jgi:uncharacterized protein YbcC (UPF0753/DUF2309 family)